MNSWPGTIVVVSATSLASTSRRPSKTWPGRSDAPASAIASSDPPTRLRNEIIEMFTTAAGLEQRGHS